MVITITWGSISSRVVARRLCSRTCEAYTRLRSGGSTRLGPTPTGSSSDPTDLRHLVLAPRVQGVVQRTLQLDLAVVVDAMHHGKAVGDRPETGGLRRPIQVGGHVGAVHDLRQAVEGRVVEPVFQDDRLEAAAA